MCIVKNYSNATYSEYRVWITYQTPKDKRWGSWVWGGQVCLDVWFGYRQTKGVIHIHKHNFPPLVDSLQTCFGLSICSAALIALSPITFVHMLFSCPVLSDCHTLYFMFIQHKKMAGGSPILILTGMYSGVRSRVGLSTLLAVKKEKQNHLLTCPVVSFTLLPFGDGVQSTPCGYIIPV